MTAFQTLQAQLQSQPKTWLITGVAGFIGSNLLEALLLLNQRVVGLDNFATGHQRNLDEVQSLVSPTQWANFQFIEGDIRKPATRLGYATHPTHRSGAGAGYALLYWAEMMMKSAAGPGIHCGSRYQKCSNTRFSNVTP